MTTEYRLEPRGAGRSWPTGAATSPRAAGFFRGVSGATGLTCRPSSAFPIWRR